MAKLKRERPRSKTREEIEREAEQRKRAIFSEDLTSRAKKFKWTKSTFKNAARADDLKLKHWKRPHE